MQTKIRLVLLSGGIYQNFTFLQRLPVLPVFLLLKITLFNSANITKVASIIFWPLVDFFTLIRNIFHHTLIMLLHYLGKVNSSNLLQTLKKMQIRKFYFRKHLVLLQITYRLIICFNFWFLLNIRCKQQKIDDNEKRGRS